MVLTVGLSSTGVMVFIAVVLMIIAIVCGSICVVRKLGKMDAERFVARCSSTEVLFICNVQSVYRHILVLLNNMC